MIMADTLGSYGSMARFRDLERIKKVNETTIVGAGGEYSDFQELQTILQDLTIEDFSIDDGSSLDSSEIFSYLTRVLYHHRTKIKPFWNQLVVGGTKKGEPFLGYIDLYGSSYQDNIAATGFGSHLAVPLMRNAWKPDLTKEEAKAVLEDGMRVLFYRDGRTINKFQLATVTPEGSEISAPYSLSANWSFKRFVDPNNAE